MCNKLQPSPMNHRVFNRGPVCLPPSLHSDTVTFWKRNRQRALWSSMTENSITSEEIVLRSEQRRRRHTISFGYMTVAMIRTPAGQNFYMNTSEKSALPNQKEHTDGLFFTRCIKSTSCVWTIPLPRTKSNHLTCQWCNVTCPTVPLISGQW